MSQPVIIIAAASLIGLIIVAAALLRAWQSWLDLKRRELDRDVHSRRADELDHPLDGGTARIEVADLKERVRKLEAIANGVDL